MSDEQFDYTQEQDAQQQQQQENSDLVFMRKYGITNNIFYTIFTSVTDYFKIAVLSLLFLGKMSKIRTKIIVLYAIIFALNRFIQLTNNVMYSFLELAVTGGILFAIVSIMSVTVGKEPKIAEPTEHAEFVHRTRMPVETQEPVVRSVKEESAPIVQTKKVSAPKDDFSGMEFDKPTTQDILSMITKNVENTYSHKSSSMEEHFINTMNAYGAKADVSKMSWLK